jgi:2-desacetyl-2-hydroxyethyl bacteriochlorophyllide A dehydrogenase
MREAILVGTRRFAVKDMPEPVLGEDEVLIEVHYCGICGSDLHTYLVGVPARYGHEFSGDVVRVGSGVSGWQKGDRVIAESISPCGACYWCVRGQMGLCASFYETWGQRAGGFANLTKARSSILHRIPTQVSYEEAALVEPAAVALHAVRLSGMRVGDSVVVLGLGPIGQLAARLAVISGASAVYATEATRSRIELAEGKVDEVIDASVTDAAGRILEITGGRGADVVLECAGAEATTQQAIAVTRKGGTLVIAGVCLKPVQTPVSSIVLNELTVKGSMCYYPGEYADALDLIARKKIDVAPLVTSVIPLEDINKAFEMAVNGEGGKILVKP